MISGEREEKPHERSLRHERRQRLIGKYNQDELQDKTEIKSPKPSNAQAGDNSRQEALRRQ